jgi:hypothetical protein
VGGPPTSRGPRPQLPLSGLPPRSKPGPPPEPKGRGLASAQAAAGGHAPGLSPKLADLALKIDALLRSKGIGGSKQYPQALAIKQVGDGYVVSLSGDPATVGDIQNSVQLPPGFEWGNAVGDTSGFQSPYDGGPLSETCAEPRLPRGTDGGDPAVLWRGNAPNKYPYPGNPQFMLPCPSCGTNWGTMFGSL